LRFADSAIPLRARAPDDLQESLVTELVDSLLNSIQGTKDTGANPIGEKLIAFCRGVEFRRQATHNHQMPGINESRLTAAAADTYILTSDLALVFGVLSWDQYLLRVRFIRDSAQPGSFEAEAAAQTLHAEEFDTEEEWPIAESAKLAPDTEPLESQLSILKDAVPPVLHYLAAGSMGLSQWRFYLGDPDLFPSIPHGHSLLDKRKKLDAYRGWIFGSARESVRAHCFG